MCEHVAFRSPQPPSILGSCMHTSPENFSHKTAKKRARRFRSWASSRSLSHKRMVSYRLMVVSAKSGQIFGRRVSWSRAKNEQLSYCCLETWLWRRITTLGECKFNANPEKSTPTPLASYLLAFAVCTSTLPVFREDEPPMPIVTSNGTFLVEGENSVVLPVE
jgi:hypothetical protein